MSMRPDEQALKTAQEITIAAVGNLNTAPNSETGESVAAFFEAVYNRVLKIIVENKNI